MMLNLPARLVMLTTMAMLFGCSGQDSTSVSLTASEAAASDTATGTAASAANASQTLTTTDNKISITVPQGQFADQLNNAAMWVDKQGIDTLTLLQRDDNNGITLSVNNLGKPKDTSEAYFKKLADTLKSDSDLQDLKIGMATGNRMGYRFTRDVNGTKLAEECIALYNENDLSVICASSDMVDPPQLTDLLKNISVQS